MKTLPKSIYVKIERPANDEPFLLTSEVMYGLNVEVGDKTKIGLYKLVGTYDVEGTITTSKLSK